MWKSSRIIVFVSLLVRCCFAERLAPALYVFGDSVVDSGNNNYLCTAEKANYMPYGIDHPNGPTGRWNDGKTITDVIAEFLGLPYPPPFLGLSYCQRKQTTTGVNYASGGSGILDETRTFYDSDGLTLNQQIAMFQETVEKDLPGQFSDAEELSTYLSKAIFYVNTATNDFGNNLFQPWNVNFQKDPDEFAKYLIEKFSEALKRLYKLGARKLVVPLAGLIGCSMKEINMQSNHTCNETRNAIVNKYNVLVPAMLQRLRSELKGSIWSLQDNSPVDYLKTGVKKFNEACCKVGPMWDTPCVKFSKPCDDRTKYYYFDSFHPNAAVSKLVAEMCIHNTVCTPNLEELVRL